MTLFQVDCSGVAVMFPALSPVAGDRDEWPLTPMLFEPHTDSSNDGFGQLRFDSVGCADQQSDRHTPDVQSFHFGPFLGNSLPPIQGQIATSPNDMSSILNPGNASQLAEGLFMAHAAHHPNSDTQQHAKLAAKVSTETTVRDILKLQNTLRELAHKVAPSGESWKDYMVSQRILDAVDAPERKLILDDAIASLRKILDERIPTSLPSGSVQSGGGTSAVRKLEAIDVGKRAAWAAMKKH